MTGGDRRVLYQKINQFSDFTEPTKLPLYRGTGSLQTEADVQQDAEPLALPSPETQVEEVVDTVDTVDSGYQGIGNAKCNATEQYLFYIYIFCSMYIGLSKLTIYVSEERCLLRTSTGVPQKNRCYAPPPCLV